MVSSSAALLLATIVAGAPADASPGRIEIPSVLIRLIEQVDVPAREAGVLVSVAVGEGQMVEEGDELARISDVEARIARDRAKIDLAVAQKNAENDVNVRFAKKSAAVAKAELARAMESIKKYSKSISDSEMDRLRLTVERAVLEIEQAQRESEIARFALQVKEYAYRAADEKVQRRKIIAPISGVVVQVDQRRGEWVEPGEMVLRILRIDRLRAEGFVGVKDLRHKLVDRPVKLAVQLPGGAASQFPGRVVFLSPEIDPVNAQIRIWAEIENRGLKLRPGMRAKMTVDVAEEKRGHH